MSPMNDRLSRYALDDSVEFLQRSFPFINAVEMVIQLGSGLAAEGILDEEWGRASLREMPHMPTQESLAQHPLAILWGVSGSVKTLILSGRYHLYEGYGMLPCILPIWTAVQCGARNVLLCNAAGGIRDDLAPGTLMLLTDHINNLGVSPLVGHRHLLQDSFVDMTGLYSPRLRASFTAAAAAVAVRLHEGVYQANMGPQFETPAEVRMARVHGADAVGMSTVLEAIVAHALGARVIGASIISNRAAGLSDDDVTHARNAAISATAGPTLIRVIRRWLRHEARLGL